MEPESGLALEVISCYQMGGVLTRDFVDDLVAALERAERLEAAAREVSYEIERMEHLSGVPQLGQIALWRGTLRAALAPAPAEEESGEHE